MGLVSFLILLDLISKLSISSLLSLSSFILLFFFFSLSNVSSSFSSLKSSSSSLSLEKSKLVIGIFLSFSVFSLFSLNPYLTLSVIDENLFWLLSSFNFFSSLFFSGISSFNFSSFLLNPQSKLISGCSLFSFIFPHFMLLSLFSFSFWVGIEYSFFISDFLSLLNPHLISVSGFLIFSFLIKSDLVIDSDCSLFFLSLSVILISAFGFSLFVINSNRDGRLLLLLLLIFSEKWNCGVSFLDFIFSESIFSVSDFSLFSFIGFSL